MNSHFLQQLRANPALPLKGIILTLPAPELAEICVTAGFDWLFLDLEHGALEVNDVRRIIQTVGDRCPCLVRIPDNEAVWYKKVLDMGAAGIIVPLVNAPEQAARAVQFSKYPPQGARSVGLGRAQGYGTALDAYLRDANANTALVIQIEHIDAVRCVDEILAIPGIDGVFIGPYDLSASLNKTGQIDDEDVQAAIAIARSACLARRIPVGILAVGSSAATRAFASGYSLVVTAIDVSLFSRAATDLVCAIQPP